MYCNKCGNQVDDNAKFCNKCGEKLNHREESAIDDKADKIPEKAEENIEVKKVKSKKIEKAVIGVVLSIVVVLVISNGLYKKSYIYGLFNGDCIVLGKRGWLTDIAGGSSYFCLVNKNGNVKLLNGYISVYENRNCVKGLIAIANSQRKIGFLNSSGEEVIKCQYDQVYRKSNAGMDNLCVVEKDGKYGCLDANTGKEIIPTIYTGFQKDYDYRQSRFKKNDSDGIIKAEKKTESGKGDTVYIDIATGKEIATYDYGKNFSEGLAYVESDDFEGYINTQGKKAISKINIYGNQFRISGADSFSEGLAYVNGDDGNGKSCRGYIDTSGNLVINFEYSDFVEGGQFSNGLAKVRKRDFNNGTDKWGYIDKSGNEIISCEYDKAEDFSGEVAYVEKDENGEIINILGGKVSSVIYGGALEISEGLFEVSKDGKHSLINVSGELETEYDSIHSFSEGFAGVKSNGKYGFINTSGHEVIPCKYDWVEYFSDGLAVVERNGKYGYVDTSGHEVIPCSYDWAGYFQEGLASISQNGRGCFIDKEGKTVIEQKRLFSWKEFFNY